MTKRMGSVYAVLQYNITTSNLNHWDSAYSSPLITPDKQKGGAEGLSRTVLSGKPSLFYNQ